MIDQLVDTDEDNNKSRHLDFLNGKYLYRVFNNKSWDQGGRFYGPFWQRIPKSYRKYITIDDTPTVEIDYSSLHPQLLYHSVKKIGPKDTYEIDIEGFDRKHIKRLLNIMINATGEDNALRGFKREYKAFSHKSIHDAMNVIRDVHKPIADHFYTGYGLTLMKLDSDIAEKVLLRAINDYETVVLPVHDSFICVESFQTILRQLMYESYVQVFGENWTQSASMKTTGLTPDDKMLSSPAGLTGNSKARNRQLRRVAKELQEQNQLTIHTQFENDYYPQTIRPKRNLFSDSELTGKSKDRNN